MVITVFQLCTSVLLALFATVQSKPCYTMKMMMVGSAGKGKTTLLSLLTSEKSTASKIPTHHNYSTVGINIKKWRYVSLISLLVLLCCP